MERVKFFSIRDKYFAYDISSTNCVEIDAVALSILPEILSGRSRNLEYKYQHIYHPGSLRKCIKECRELIENKILGTQPEPYTPDSENNVTSVCLHVAHDCNLRCIYCYAGTGSFGNDRKLMDHDVMMRSVDFALEASGNSNELSIGFFGGEPLLNFKIIREAVEYSKAGAEKRNKKVDFRMTTNATLLSREIMKFLEKENFALLFSIDGPQKIHDRMRKFKGGIPSFQCVMKNIKKYSNNYSADFTVRGTFTRATPNFSEQVLFLNRQGFKSVSVEPAQLNPEDPNSITSDGEIMRIKYEYDRLADIYLESFRSGSPIHFFHFDHCLIKLLQPHPHHSECGSGAGLISITPDGKIFPCFEAVVEEENCIGHIDSGFYPEKRNVFSKMFVDTREGCRECWLRYYCGGGCHAFNIRYNKNIHLPYRPHCELTKHRFMLACWILSEINSLGNTSIRRLKRHLLII